MLSVRKPSGKLNTDDLSYLIMIFIFNEIQITVIGIVAIVAESVILKLTCWTKASTGLASLNVTNPYLRIDLVDAWLVDVV